MRESINANVLFNTVAMVAPETRAAVVVVEGDDDHHALLTHVHKEVQLLPSAGGRPTLLKVAEAVERHRVRRAVFLADSEYDGFCEAPTTYPGCVATSEQHDFFMDMIVAAPSSLDRTIAAHVRSARRAAVGALPSEHHIRSIAMALAARIGLLRVLNQEKGYNIPLNGFPFGDLSSVTPSHAEVASLASKRLGGSVSASEILNGLEDGELRFGLNDPRLVGDHDFFAALARVMREYGVRNASSSQLFTSYIASLTCQTIGAASWFNHPLVLAGAQLLACPCSD